MILSPLPKLAFLGNNGRPLVGGQLFTYVAGTTTKISTYTDEGGGTPNTNPVILDFRGECNVWLDPELTYKFVLADRQDTDPPANPIWSVDDISGLGGLTQQIIGKLLWPQTAAEIAANVTPSNYAYPPLNVRRYGAVLDGVTHDTAAFTSAISVAHEMGGGEVTYDGDTVCVNLAMLDGVTLTNAGKFVINGDPSVGTDYIVTATGTVTGVSQALSANAKQGASSVTVAASTGLAIGDYVLIRQQTFVSGSDGQQQQITQIRDISGGTISLRDSLFDDFTTASTAEIVKITPVRYTFNDVILANPQPTSGSNDGGCLKMAYCTDVHFNNCELSGASFGQALRFDAICSNVYGSVWVHDCPGGSPGSSVGVGVYVYNCHNIYLYTRLENITECSIEFRTRWCEISFDANNVKDSAWNTHGNGNHDIVFKDFSVNGSDSVGLAIGFGSQVTHDERVKAINGKISGTVSHGISTSASVGKENLFCEIIDVEIRAFKASGGSTAYGINAQFSDDLKISNVVIDGTTVTNAVDGLLNFGNCDRLNLNDCKLVHAPSGFGIQIDQCTDYRIDFIDIQDCANYLNTTTTTSSFTGACKILNCTADTASPTFSIEAAVYQAGNSWNSGSFTGVLTGMTATVNITVNYTRNGYMVLISYAGASGTSNATTMTLTGAPSSISPTAQQRIYAQSVLDNGGPNSLLGRVTVETSGTMTYATDLNGTAFTNANSKGVNRSAFAYSLL